MDIPILFEDTDILVVNKPPGVVVNRADTVKGETIQDWMEKKYITDRSAITEETRAFFDRGGVVHRLDKETSGVLILAKNPIAFFALQGQFKERGVQKTYLALVHGKPPQDGDINAPVGRLPWNRERFGIVPGGKESQTHYHVLKTLTSHGGEISEVEVHPKTGRTHQIRVHFKYIGFPLVGDYLYAGRKTSRDDREWAPRVMLHAWKIQFSHPFSKKQLDFESPIPDDMRSLISSDGTT
jgi:23S rRNA pseudouridine1911/1915/1917 synthase